MHSLLRLIVLAFVAQPTIRAHLGKATIACDRNELIALRAAPRGVSRVSQHRLNVRWSRGVASFRDSPGYDGNLGGTGYEYCGYLPAVGFHLIAKMDDGVFTGVLLNNATGRVLAAGEAVSFAANGRYFASVQPNGLEGEEWYVYSRAGLQLWEGYSFISANHVVFATLERPHWGSKDQLQATLTCSIGDSPPALVTLTQRKGSWRWDPIPCP